MVDRYAFPRGSVGTSKDAGKVTAEIAKAHAHREFEKYRVIQDHLYESDFDRELNKLLGQDSKNKDTE